ncbi:ABC transporter permease [Spirochaetota bacterium]
MNLRIIILSTIKVLARNKLRSSITSIGIIIGISSVIIMVGLGNSARITVRDRVINYGANAMLVRSVITMHDILFLKRTFPQIKYITPFSSKKEVMVKYSKMNMKGTIVGVNNDFFKLMNRGLLSGRFFTNEEVIKTAKVAIIGTTNKKELFGNVNPIGKQIIANNIPLLVIGVLEPRGQTFSTKDFDNQIVIPHTTYLARILKNNKIVKMYVSTHNERMVDDTILLITKYLRRKFSVTRGQREPFRIYSSRDKLKLANEISSALSMLIAGIASISLFVGGVGIMNIMFVSVTERTREIGIRMAIGAKKKDILIQFLSESVAICFVGGIVGILLGLVLYYVIIYFVKWPFIFSFTSVIISVLFSAAVGIFFGFYPARKASNLKPIEALKYE